MTDFYFSPLKLFEYMAAGRAVVASRIGQIPEIVRDGETGLLTVPGDPVDLAAKIRCLYRDRHLRERLGCEARRESFHHHGWDSRVGAVMELIPSNGTLEVPAPAAVTSLPA
jgi:glycosyltransferase involved in cell wall biosynthesis